MASADSIKDSDYKIQQISRLLESGGTMLAQHCNVCGAPFFRYHGEILCPVCSTVGEQSLKESAEELVSIPHPHSEDVLPQAKSAIISTLQESKPELSETPSAGDDISSMTGKSCGVCGSPLFTYHDKIFCPMCDDERHMSVDKTELKSGFETIESSVLQEEVTVSVNLSGSQEYIVPTDKPEVSSTYSIASGPTSLEQILLQNIETIATKTVEESDGNISEWLDLTESIVTLVERINTMRGEGQLSAAMGNTLLSGIENIVSNMVEGSEIQKIRGRFDLIKRTEVLAERIKKL